MYSSMKLSDRTISYDTGLNLQKLNEDCDDDELGIVILPSSKKLLHNGTTKSTGVSERRRASRKTGKEHSFPVIFAVRTRQIHSRGATSLKLSSFELFELFIFELEPSPSLGSILVFELRALDVELRALTRAFAK